MSSIESHNAFEKGERYHAFLRKVCRKIRLESLDLGIRLALLLAIKAVNDTAGPSSLESTLLDLEIMSTVYTTTSAKRATQIGYQNVCKADCTTGDNVHNCPNVYTIRTYIQFSLQKRILTFLLAMKYYSTGKIHW